FPVHSPFIAKVNVKRGGETRRAKLFYLRKRVGKAVRLTEKRKGGKKEAGTPAPRHPRRPRRPTRPASLPRRRPEPQPLSRLLSHKPLPTRHLRLHPRRASVKQSASCSHGCRPW